MLETLGRDDLTRTWIELSNTDLLASRLLSCFVSMLLHDLIGHACIFIMVIYQPSHRLPPRAS